MEPRPWSGCNPITTEGRGGVRTGIWGRVALFTVVVLNYRLNSAAVRFLVAGQILPFLPW